MLGHPNRHSDGQLRQFSCQGQTVSSKQQEKQRGTVIEQEEEEDICGGSCLPVSSSYQPITVMVFQRWFGASLALLLLVNGGGDAFSADSCNRRSHAKIPTQEQPQPQSDELNNGRQRRRQFLSNLVGIGASPMIIATSSLSSLPFPAEPSFAFDGSGSSAYSGRSPATKAELKRQYQERIVADVRDFNVLGKAIANGETEGNAWVNFFIQFQRREPDAVGRAYAALVDLRGVR